MPRLDQLIINPTNVWALQNYLASPGHALILAGERGVGLTTIARTLASQLTDHIIVIEPSFHDKQTTEIINADDIDGLIELLSIKRARRLVVVVDRVDQAADEVFTKLLKSIEEPNPMVHFIMTTHNLSATPDTICSRSAIIKIARASMADCDILFDGVSSDKRNQLQFMAAGRPALIKRLLVDPDALARITKQFAFAKQFLAADISERLAMIANLADRSELQNLIDAMATILDNVITLHIQPEQVVYQLNTLERLSGHLSEHANYKLVALALAYQFGKEMV